MYHCLQDCIKFTKMINIASFLENDPLELNLPYRTIPTLVVIV